MLNHLAVITGFFAGFAIPVFLALFVPANRYAAGSEPLVGVWRLFLTVLFLVGPPAGGYFADRLFNKTRRYDPDYDDRPPTDPA